MRYAQILGAIIIQGGGILQNGDDYFDIVFNYSIVQLKIRTVSIPANLSIHVITDFKYLIILCYQHTCLLGGSQVIVQSYIRRGPLINTTESHTANYTRKFLKCTLFFTRRGGNQSRVYKKIAQFPCPLRQFRIIGLVTTSVPISSAPNREIASLPPFEIAHCIRLSLKKVYALHACHYSPCLNIASQLKQTSLATAIAVTLSMPQKVKNLFLKHCNNDNAVSKLASLISP